MNRPVLLAPLAIEKAAVWPARSAFTVVRAGMGARAARAVAHRYAGRPVLVVGVAGGLAPEVGPGDLVVADEVRGGPTPVPVPAAVLLAAALRRAGLRVRVGPIVSSPRVVTGARRRQLADTGALAVDMESAWLAPPPPMPFAVVRAIVDTADHPLTRPGTLVRGLAALRALRAAVPALTAWAAQTISAGGSMPVADSQQTLMYAGGDLTHGDATASDHTTG